MTSSGGSISQERFEVGDEVTGQFRCAACDLLIESPKENDGVLVLPTCPLCHHEEWRRVS
jgi:Zn finger protein HypA/HybF involved in hydrogenase expression